MNSFEKLKSEILSCRDCKNKFGFLPRPIVFGSQNSKIFQISQAPSRNVSLTGKPFTDKTGRRLIKDWYDIDEKTFYNEDNFYITSLAHCYPGKTKSGNDRYPPLHCAKKWLLKELEVVNNRIYVVIGRRAAQFLFPGKDYNELIFNNQHLNGKLALVLPHPSPLNIKWFKENPDFYSKRLIEIRKIIKKVLA